MNISTQQYRDLLVTYLGPQRWQVFGLALLILSNIGLQLLNPQLMRRFIDNALSGTEVAQLTMLAAAFIGIALAQQIVAVVATYLSENVSWTATNWLRYDLARHCLYLDMGFHNRQTPGAMIERIDGDINTLSRFFSQFVLQVLGNGLLLVGILILLWREHWQLGLVLSIFVVMMLLLLSWLRNAAVPHWKRARAASADFFSFLEERLAATEDIRTSGATAYVMRRFYEYLRTFWRTTVRARLMAFVMVNLSWVLFGVGTAVVFVISAMLYRANALTIGSVYLVVHYTGMISRPIERISAEVQELQQAGAGLARIHELRQETRDLSEPTAPVSVSTGPLSVTFKGVSFAYRTDPTVVPSTDAPATDAVAARQEHLPTVAVDKMLDEEVNRPEDELVLDELSFQLEAGSVLGLLGRTGSGKTTLARLLFRLYDPTAGCISINNTDLRQIDFAELRQRIGIVNQNVQLFHASVRDNLTFFDQQVDDAQILDALAILGLQAWFEQLSAGLDTVLDASGSNLSAGEAQLLAFARIFLKDPGLIIFDEASSRLDPATEQLIEAAMTRLLHKRTAIIIAHRLATVQRADTIMILEAGEIREHGMREALAADPTSRFAALLRTGMEESLA